MTDSAFPTLLESLKTSPSAPDAKAASEKLAREVQKVGLQSLKDEGILDALYNWASNKKSGYERESAPIAFQAFAIVIGAPIAPLLLPSLPILFDLYADKGDVVVAAAKSATKAILKLFPPEAARIVCRALEEVLSSNKWQTKVGALDAIRGLVSSAKEQIANEIATVLPVIEKSLHDTKKEVSSAANKCAVALCGTLDNADIVSHIPALVKCMGNPDNVPAVIKSLSSTTFVAEVKAPALAVLVPLLLRALNDRSMEVQRRTVVVIDNLVKLVRDPTIAATYLSPLVDGTERIAKGAAFPEVRAFANTALNTLLKSGASSSAPPASPRDLDAERISALAGLLTLLPSELHHDPASFPNGPHTPFHPVLGQTLDFSASLVADLIFASEFYNNKAWARAAGTPLSPWLAHVSDSLTGPEYAERVREHFLAIDEAKRAPPEEESADEGELLCDTIFSLAYGALLLLSHTRLKLYRGRRYGILGPNGSGKSTLMRQLRDGKVENFPPQDQLRCLMVEHALQGEITNMSIIDFIASDKQLSNIPKSQIRESLLEVGFDDARQAELVSGLSGGWKMKLELARAMLHNADLLLLDEPTNHLDRASVQWLERYLISKKNVTCLIVSHDSGFLDTVTTDIMHYEGKKLAFYRGNLSSFVEVHPEAKSYYTLAATSIKFRFPPPGSLMGVRSNTRAIMKMTNCTFTYPGKSTPQLSNVSCALSLSSRVGVIGPNGAGKSTMIKLLTGETEPQEGTVYRHPALRIGYVSQHATHHIERHLEKTPVQYIQWRYQDGYDRELLEKSTRIMTDEEREALDIDFVGKDGSKRKIEMIMGRSKLKKSFQYEVKWRGFDHKFNTWIPREELLEKGFSKIMGQFDDIEASREGAATRDTSAHLVRKHLEDIGLDGDIAQYNEISGLSGGQKIKLVIAACLWNNPQICVLDEPSNFLDREALGGLAVAIRDWAGAVIIISHNEEFITALCTEIWNVDKGRMTHKGKASVVEDAFADAKLAAKSGANTPAKSGFNTPAKSRNGTPAASAGATPAGSGGEGTGSPMPKKKTKKLTRNQQKERDERRKKRKLDWLIHGGPRPEDTDDE